MTAHLPLAPGLDLVACVDSYPRQWATLPGLVKIQEDLARYHTIMDATWPTLVVECGTWSGASARWFARHPCAPEVVTIDLDPSGYQYQFDHPAVTRISGVSSTDPITVGHVHSHMHSGAQVMVVLDSNHAPAHVLAEIAAYGPLVTPGQYMVVEDGICRHVPGTPVTDAGPLDAVEAWVEMGGADGWERDLVIEGLYPVTHHLGGWWRKGSVL